MKVRCFYALFFLAVGAVSCDKMQTAAEEGDAILLLPGISATKAAVSDGYVPEDYTVYLSAYYNNSTADESSGNYLTGEPFRKNGTYWSATPTVYWPMGGYLDFLALAADDFDVQSNASWYEDNVARSVSVTVPDGSCLDSEILYASASSKKDSDKCVSLSFSHSQSWIQLRLCAAKEGTTRIDSIRIEKVYLGGTLRVDNDVYLSAGWDFHGYFRQDYTLPESRMLVLGTSITTMNLLLPEQESCAMTVWYTQKEAGESSWENCTRKTSFEVKAGANPWHAGTKTVYTMTVLEQVSMKAAVCSWDEDNRQITID